MSAHGGDQSIYAKRAVSSVEAETLHRIGLPIQVRFRARSLKNSEPGFTPVTSKLSRARVHAT